MALADRLEDLLQFFSEWQSQREIQVLEKLSHRLNSY